MTNRHFQLARRAWAAYASADPRRLGRLVSAGASVFALLPKLRAALLAQVREYPDSVTGLSHMERHLLATVKRLGPGAAVGGVVRETLAWDKAHFGDLLMLGMLRNFTRCSHPLAEFAEPFDGDTVEQFFKARLTITAFGRRVLAGKASHIAANGIDRWLGGVHLQGRDCRWRWDKAAGRIVAAANRRS